MSNINNFDRKVVLDTETTGLDLGRGHRIISIGCVEVVNRVKTGRHLHIFVNPGRSSDPGALAIHGITDEFLRDKPKFAEIAKVFLDFIGRDPLIIHNAQFDLKFLRNELQIAGFKGLEQNQIIDTLLLARRKYPGSPASLDALCKKFNIDTSERVNHGALVDSELLASVYIAMTDAVQGEMALPDDSFHHAALSVERKTVPVPRTPRFFEASNEEMVKHQEAIKKIKDPLWASFYSQVNSKMNGQVNNAAAGDKSSYG